MGALGQALKYQVLKYPFSPTAAFAIPLIITPGADGHSPEKLAAFLFPAREDL